MKPSTEKFLKFNDRTISFLAIDGQYWIAIKPICAALNVDYIQQFKNLKEDEILGQLLCEHTMVGADNRARKMVALPEKYIYGYLFSIKSESAELLEYKRECYDLLYNHFHGAITGRDVLLKGKTQHLTELSRLKTALLDNEDFSRVRELEKEIKAINKDLSSLDKQRISEQLALWNS